MRTVFDEKLTLLNDSLIEMGGCIEHAIIMAVKALAEQDTDLAKYVIQYDDKIDAKEKQIEKLCLEILLLQQPLAGDLRMVSSAIKMITDMERIGDQSADIAEITLQLAGRPYIKKLEHIPKMANATIKMVNDAIDAYVKKDVVLALSVIRYDDVVDEYFTLVRQELIKLIEKDTANCEQALDLMMIAKYFERIGDHATNIAEWAVFSLTGSHEYDKIV